MNKHFLFLLFLFSSRSSNGQSPVDTSLTGSWQGRSICLIRPSPCNDEIAIYHISKAGGDNSYHIVMNKMVNGREEGMAEYDYRYESTKRTLTAIDETHNLTWHFLVKEKQMEGTLVRRDTVYRVIHLHKTW